MWKSLIESFVFFPDTNMMDSPDSFQIPFQDIFLQNSSGEKYHGWFMESNDFPIGSDGNPVKNNVILFFHGNAGNISTRISFFKKLYQQHFTILAFDYPGFGKSQGKPSEESCIQSALLFFHFLHKEKKYSRKQIILWGESLGGSLATSVSLQTHSPLLVLQSTFTDIQEMIRKVAPKIPSFIYHSIGFETKRDLKKRYQMTKLNKNMKTLILHSREDDLIPFTHAEVLKKYATLLYECHGKHTSPKFQDSFFQELIFFIS